MARSVTTAQQIADALALHMQRTERLAVLVLDLNAGEEDAATEARNVAANADILRAWASLQAARSKMIQAHHLSTHAAPSRSDVRD